MAFRLRNLCAVIGAVLVICAPALAPAEPIEPDATEATSPATTEAVPHDAARPQLASPRIVAIGDLHGDHAAFRAIVEAAGLVDANGGWIGGDAILVQTGDVVDRGPDSLPIIRDLMRLQQEANAAGGQVIVLIGNHEAMVVIGDLRYVHEGEYAAFRDDLSENRRRRYYRTNQARIERAYRRREPALTEDQIRRLWIEETPLGAIQLLAAWGPEGEIGRWLADNPAVAMVGDTLFVHGGISDAYAALPIAEINLRVATAIAARDDAPDSIISDPAGPLWYRGYFLRGQNGEVAVVPPVDAAPEIDRVLTAYGAERIVVGHTTSLGEIRILLDGRLIAIDTGISAHYGGRRTYLEVRGDEVVAQDVSEGGGL